jgi:hypothetical protein
MTAVPRPGFSTAHAAQACVGGCVAPVTASGHPDNTIQLQKWSTITRSCDRGGASDGETLRVESPERPKTGRGAEASA